MRKKASREEWNEATSVITKVVNTEQSIKMNCVPEGLCFEEYKNYFFNAVKNLTEAAFLYENWQERVRRNYNVENFEVEEGNFLFPEDFKGELDD